VPGEQHKGIVMSLRFLAGGACAVALLASVCVMPAAAHPYDQYIRGRSFFGAMFGPYAPYNDTPIAASGASSPRAATGHAAAVGAEECEQWAQETQRAPASGLFPGVSPSLLKTSVKLLQAQRLAIFSPTI